MHETNSTMHTAKWIVHLYTRVPGAALVRVLRVHLHPLKFGKGCSAPVLRGMFNTEDQQLRENYRIHGLKWTFCTRPFKTLTRPLKQVSP